MKESEDPGKFLGLYWLESDFEREKQSEILQNQKTDGKKSREVELVCQCLSGNLNDLEYFPVAETNFGKANVSFQIRGCWIGLTKEIENMKGQILCRLSISGITFLS